LTVLAQPRAEAAAMLDVSIAALKSLLQRAGAPLEQHTTRVEDIAEPVDAGTCLVLDRYMAAFEQSDMQAIEALLTEGTVLEMTGTATLFSGKTTCVPFIANRSVVASAQDRAGVGVALADRAGRRGRRREL
jgi:RNA polymerase sigma-70 factor (ECF subfamily)